MAATFKDAIGALSELDPLITALEDGDESAVECARDVIKFLASRTFNAELYAALLKAIRGLAEGVAEKTSQEHRDDV